MIVYVRKLIVLSLALYAIPLLAEDAIKGPVIEAYGPTLLVEDRDIPLVEGFDYRVVFDVAAYRGDKNSLNLKLVSVARYLNMHARNGVPVENMTVAVVLHGTALKNALSNSAYASRHGALNPNLDLISKLHEKGVAFYACGQSMGFSGITKSDLAGPVKVVLSSMTMLTVLQSDGYALIP
jgi:intracellular sulfur oxidation DsrE/DsrF family protein